MLAVALGEQCHVSGRLRRVVSCMLEAVVVVLGRAKVPGRASKAALRFEFFFLSVMQLRSFTRHPALNLKIN